MYEQSMRLIMESNSLESMQKRCDSLLMCMNSMHLIDPRYRWIAKPVIGDENRNNSKNLNDSELMDTTDALAKSQVVVLEIKDIRKELLQTEALINLAQHRKDIDSFINAGPQELSVILSANCGLFTAAIKLAKGFDLSMLHIFESLTAACVRTTEENGSEAWNWLQENDLAGIFAFLFILEFSNKFVF